MAITNNSSFVPTMNLFLAHFTQCNAALAPGVLTPLNRWWMRLADLLNRVFSPIVLGLMFFVILTPLAAAMRLFGRDEMRRRWDRGAASYWVPRDPPGPPRGSLDQQF